MAERIPVYPQYAHSALSWRVGEGEAVTRGKVIAMNERESAKGSAAVMAPASGTVVDRVPHAGKIDEPIAYIEAE